MSEDSDGSPEHECLCWGTVRLGRGRRRESKRQDLRVIVSHFRASSQAERVLGSVSQSLGVGKGR